MDKTSSSIIIHGTRGSPQANWFPWLSEKLYEKGYNVVMPDFPTPEGQSLENWLAILDSIPIDQNTILIGHSIGAAFVLHALERLEIAIRAAILVAPFMARLNLLEYDALNASFIQWPSDGRLIRKKAKYFFCIAGDNDPYVPLSLSQEVADKLDVELQVVKNGGHLNAESGYTQFPLLLEYVINIPS